MNLPTFANNFRNFLSLKFPAGFLEFCDIQSYSYIRLIGMLFGILNILQIFSNYFFFQIRDRAFIGIYIVAALIFFITFLLAKRSKLIRSYNLWFVQCLALSFTYSLSLFTVKNPTFVWFVLSAIWLSMSFLTFYQPYKFIIIVFSSLITAAVLFAKSEEIPINRVFYHLQFMLLLFSAIVSVFLSLLSWNRSYREWSYLEQLEQKRNQLEKYRNNMSKELELAVEVQKRSLPRNLKPHNDLHLVYEYIPYDGVSGDVIEVFEIEKNHFALLIADVAGHGIAPALLSSMLKMSIHSQDVALLKNPRRLLAKLNGIFHDYLEKEYITLVYAHLDMRWKWLTYSAAGHEAPIIVRDDGNEIIYKKPKGMAIGLRKHVEYKSETIKLKPNDLIYFFTDGCFELFDETGTILPFQDFKNILQRHFGRNLHQLTASLVEELRRHNNGESFHDDFSILACRIS